MVKIQLELNDKTDDIVKTVQYFNKFKTKKQAIDYIIRFYGDNHK